MTLVPTIQGTIETLKSIITIWKTARHISALPQTYRDVAACLPIVQYTLERMFEGLEGEGGLVVAESRQPLTEVLESCSKKALRLKNILEGLVRISTSTSIMRYPIYVIDAFRYEEEVRGIKNGISNNIQCLTAFYSFMRSTQAQVRE
ncbi:hypothetical protein V8C34DRAFT_316238 [Trichoderma compactum]